MKAGNHYKGLSNKGSAALAIGVSVCLVFLSGCSTLDDNGTPIITSAPTTHGRQSVTFASAEPPTALTEDRQKVVAEAIQMIGTPYRWGGNTPTTGFDCSGLVQYVMRHAADLALPRTTDELSQAGVQISPSQLTPGDLVFFNTERHPHSHVGIYVGHGQFINAPSSGGSVRVDRLASAYWANRLDGIRRIMAPANTGQPTQPRETIAREDASQSRSSSTGSSWPMPVPAAHDPIAEALARHSTWMAEQGLE
ncbi:hypothetical protein GWC77_27270 [Paraburkholderia sp. NMBU_R16]|nr:hypothetical protein [Paraburkholderia sp. NMBU_R16]